MVYKYIGLIKKNIENSKVLVLSDQGRYYVWDSTNAKVEDFRIKGSGEISNTELELANQRQIDIGRGGMWKPNSSKVMVQVEFHGIISGGQHNKRVLVKSLSTGVANWRTVVVDAKVANNARAGDLLTVDLRFLSEARKDHIAAGLGCGTLQRRRSKV